MLQILEYLALASVLSLAAVGLKLVQRTTGVFLLETVLAAFAVTLPVSAYLANAPSSDLRETVSLYLVAALAIVATMLLLPGYRVVRNARGGESMALVISYSAMNCLTLLAVLLTGGRQVNTRPALGDLSPADAKLWVEVVGAILGPFLVLLLALAQRRLAAAAALGLARDDDRILQSFAFSPARVRYLGFGLGFGMLTIGVLGFLSLQESFALVLKEKLLIPVFALALLSDRLQPSRILLGALVFVPVERTLVIYGSPVLERAYASALFGVFVLIASVGGNPLTDWRDRLRRNWGEPGAGHRSESLEARDARARVVTTPDGNLS